MTIDMAGDEGCFLLDPDDAKILSEIGFIAAYQGDIVRADAVFDGLAMARPNRAYPWVGKALVRIHLGRAEEAARLFEQQKKFINDQDELEVMQVWHGMALQLSGHSNQAYKLLAKLANGVGPGRALAQSLLGLREGSQ
jgi:Flp pilus assembly protein TadD